MNAALKSDPDLADLVCVLDLLDDERRALLAGTAQAALAYVRSGDVSHLTQHARAMVTGLQARQN